MTRESIFDTVQSLCQEKDLFAACEYVLGVGTESEVAGAFGKLVADCHYKAHSTEQVIHFAEAGINYCLGRAVANDGKDDAAARELRFAAKRMATNAASFTWPGWNEPGITISSDQMAQGLQLARYSVRQLQELNPTPGQLSFTLWFLGAQLIAHELYDEALETLEQAHDYGKELGDNPEGLEMLKGYIGMTKILSGEPEAGELEFGSALSALEAREGGEAKFYAEQLVSVRKFFEKQNSEEM